MKNNNLKALRAEKGYTQDQLAEMLGELRRTYASWERGERDIPNDVLARIAEILGTTTDRILGVNKEIVPMPSREKARAHALIDQLTDEQCRAILTLLEQKTK